MTSTAPTQPTTDNTSHNFPEIDRLLLFDWEDTKRPLAESNYLREVTELRGECGTDGRFTIDVLAGIETELEEILLQRPRSVALPMLLGKIREARLWATQWAIDEQAAIVIDRRKLRKK